MGGTITLYYAVTRQHEAQGLIVSGAAIELGSDVPAILQRIAHLAGRIVPKLPMLKLSSAGLSKDESVSSAYDADPLVYHGGIPARTGSQMIIAIERILDNLDLLTMPMLILHGEMDPLVAESGSRDLYASVPTTDKTLQVYPGLYHEILNEPERKQVLEEIGSWLEIHLNG